MADSAEAVRQPETARGSRPSGGWEAIDEVPLRRAGSPASGAGAGAGAGGGAGGGAPMIRGAMTRTVVASTAALAAPDVRRLRSSSFGTVADHGARIVQRYGRFLLLTTAVLSIPRAALDLLAVNAAYDALEDDAGVFTSLRSLFDDAAGITAYQFVITFVLTSLVAAMVGAVVAETVVRHTFNGTAEPRAVLGRVARRLPAVLAAWAISHVVWLLPLLSLSADGGSAGFGVFLAMVVGAITIPLMYVVPIVLHESIGPVAAVRRSWRFGRAVYGSSLLWTLLNGFFFAVLTLGMTLIPTVVDSLTPVGQGRWTWLTNGVASTIASIITTPIAAGVTTALYLDSRVRIEGLDIAIEARRAFADVRPQQADS